MIRAVVLAGLAVMVLAACGESQIQTTEAKVPVPAGQTASFDDVEIDQAAQTVYAADRANSGVDVFDVSGAQPRYLTTIKLPGTPNGLAIDHARGRVYAGTAGGAVEVIDTAKAAVVSEIKTTAQDIDLLDLVPGPGWLLASTGMGGTLLTIDTATGKLIATATVGKTLEQPRFDPATGKAYVAVPDIDALDVIDPGTGVVSATLKLSSCIPTGLAIRSSTGTAVITCRKSVIAYGLRDGHEANLGPRAGGADIVQYFPTVDRFFVVAQHSVVPSVVAMFGGDPVASDGSLLLDGGGNAVVYDDRQDTLYTTDERPGTAGLTGFRMDGTKPATPWQTALSVGVPLAGFLVLVLFIWSWLGRHADPIHRKRPEARPAD